MAECIVSLSRRAPVGRRGGRWQKSQALQRFGDRPDDAGGGEGAITGRGKKQPHERNRRVLRDGAARHRVSVEPYFRR